jgi:hypothetical protein
MGCKSKSWFESSPLLTVQERVCVRRLTVYMIFGVGFRETGFGY